MTDPTAAGTAGPDDPTVEEPETPGDDGYTGPATLVTGAQQAAAQQAAAQELPVQVVLRGQVDTISGSYHWYGRITADPAVTELAGALGSGTVLLRTPDGEAPTRLSDVDPWGRYRVEGRGHAPFRVLTDVADDH